MTEQAPASGHWPVNPHAGEVAIALGGVDHPMRPSFEAAVAIEQQSGMSLLAIARQATLDKNLPLWLASIVVTAGIRAAGEARDDVSLKHVNREKVQRLLFAGGIVNAVEPISQFLIGALNGGGDEKKAKPAMN
ncbi:MAG: hypothetical protein DCC73_15035 [Proteobacteria bacterium]|nr:MAG: hypothetical protein DCC73_15035 [Pseudomonadota bacterium]